MGNIPISTFLTDVRVFLNESIDPNDITNANAGNNWKNSELIEHFNKAKDDLWDLVKGAREDYFETTSASLSLNQTTKEYALASDFRQMKGMKFTTSGYEFLMPRRMDQSAQEWKVRNAAPVGIVLSITDILYDIIGTGTLKFADYPPAALTLSYDYIAFISDAAIADSSIPNVNNEWRRYLEARTVWWALQKTPADQRVPVWEKICERYEKKILDDCAPRDISQPEYVEAFNP